MIAERKRSAACVVSIYVFSRSSHCGPNGVQAHKPCNQTSRNHNGGCGGGGGGGVAQSPADAVKSRAPRPAGEYPDPRGATDLEAGVVAGRRREASDSGRPYRLFFHVSWRNQK